MTFAGNSGFPLKPVRSSAARSAPPGGQLRAEYRAAKAQFDEAKAAYQQSVLTPFQEISNALISGQRLAEVRTYDQQAVQALESSVQIATELYINGKSSYFELLQAQQERYPAQPAQVQTQASEFISVVQGRN